MKFSDNTIEILKNFSLINPSLSFKEGNKLRTVSPNKTMLASAKIEDEISSDFCIGELTRFMSCLSLFEEPEITFGEKSCIISGDNNKLEYVYTSENLITLPPKDDIKIPSSDVVFNLTNAAFSSIKKAMSVLSLTEMAFVGKKGKLFAKALNIKGVTADNFSIELGTVDSNFTVVLKNENLKMMPFDYEVIISSKGICQFSSENVTYWIPIEVESSKFE